jgi:mannosyltransferase OCH1-like enzyme
MKKTKYIYIYIFIIFIIIFIIFYKYYKNISTYNRHLYYNFNYKQNNLNKYLNLQNINKVNLITNPLFQTYHKKEKIPLDVYTNIKLYAPDYTHIVLDDNEIILFLQEYFTDEVVNTFKNLKKGPHKADLARYCLLYIYGGLYLDIKVELIKPVNDIFNHGDIFYSVISSVSIPHIHQGILKSYPKNDLFLSLIDFIIKTQNPKNYLDFCEDLYKQIKNDVGEIKMGLNTGKTGYKYYFFIEKCSETDFSLCYDGPDQYGICCFVYDNDTPVIKSRRASYPWN